MFSECRPEEEWIKRRGENIKNRQISRAELGDYNLSNTRKLDISSSTFFDVFTSSDVILVIQSGEWVRCRNTKFLVEIHRKSSNSNSRWA